MGVGLASAWDKAKPYIKNGANSATLGDYRLSLCGGQANKHTTFGPDNYLASPSIDIGPGDCYSIKEAFGYDLRGVTGGAAKPRVCPNSLPPCVNAPNIVFPALPTTVPIGNGAATTAAATACDAHPAQSLNILSGALPPNNVYSGNVGTDHRQTLKGNVSLAAGTYTFCNIQIDVTARVTTTPGTVINIVQGIQSEGGTFGSDPNTRVNLLWNGFGGMGRRGNPVYYGTYNAPNVDLNLGHSSQFFGRVWARSMTSDTGVNVTAPPPTPPPPNTTSTSTSTSTTTTTVKPTTTTTTVQTTTTTTIKPTTTTTTIKPTTTTTTTIKPTTTTTVAPSTTTTTFES
jgi:hypothetical protein